MADDPIALDDPLGLNSKLRPRLPLSPVAMPGVTPPSLGAPSLQRPVGPVSATMPNPGDPQYRPLHGWQAVLPALSQLAGIPTKTGLQPLEGVRQLGQRALEMPQQRYARDVAAAKGNIEAQTAESEGKLRTAQTGLTEVETEAKRKEMGLPKPVGNEEIPATGPNNEQLKIIGSDVGGKLVYSVAGGAAPTENSPTTAQGALEEYVKGLTPAPTTPLQPSGGLPGPALAAGTAPLPVVAPQPAGAGWKLGEAKPADRPVAPEELQSMRTSISGSGIPKDEQTALLNELREGMTQAELDKVSARADSAMGRVSAENVAEKNRKAAAQTTQDEKKALRDQDNVFAFDPKTKTRVLTTRGEAEAAGFTMAGKAVTPQEIDKEEAATRQFNDVQMNISRYRNALDSLTAAIPKDHVERMTLITSLASQADKEGGGSGIISSLTGGIAPALISQAQQGALARAWNYLTPQEQDLMTGYFRSKGSLLAFQRALTGTGRSSQMGLQLEIPNIPEPIVGSTVADKRLKAFQENIDVASKGLVRFPWIDQPEDIRKGIEKPAMPEGAIPGTLNGKRGYALNGEFHAL
jgi:hypothetical protein